MKWIFVTLVLFVAPAVAEDYQHWKEPAQGPISAPGTVIETEDIRCEVKNAYTISCLNIGRACVAFRAKKDAEDARTFGCALEDSPNHPCPPWDEMQKKINDEIKSGMISMCSGLMMGGF